MTDDGVRSLIERVRNAITGTTWTRSSGYLQEF